MLTIESVPRRFTIGVGLICSRLKLLKLGSVEVRRLWAHLLLLYKLSFVHVESPEVDSLKLNARTRLKSMRRHSHQLVEHICVQQVALSNIGMNCHISLP